MSRSIRLRQRVTLLYTLMGFVLSVLFAVAVMFIAEDYEHVLVQELLSSQVHDYSARLALAPDTRLPRTARLNAYLRRPDGTGDVPAELAGLAPGIRESDVEEEQGIHSAVYDTAAGRLFFTIDLRDIEVLEQHLVRVLAGVVLFGTLISAWFGWLLAGVVIRPVRKLADAVQKLPIRPLHTTLGRDMPRDELGRLGTAIDEYQGRLLAAESAERTFFADASHELRTPIAVVRGATELLLEDSNSPDRQALRPLVLRLDRGVRELSELLDALLRLTRGRQSAVSRVVITEWLAACLPRAPSIKDGIVRLALQGNADACDLSVSEAELVVQGILRRLLTPGTHGTLVVQVGEGTVTFRFQHGDPTHEREQGMPPRPSDRRLGLTLVGRLAERIGLEVDDRDAESGTVLLRLPVGEV